MLAAASPAKRRDNGSPTRPVRVGGEGASAYRGFVIALVLKLFALLAMVVLIAWTWLTDRETVPLSERTQIVSFSEEEMAALGAQAYNQAIAGKRLVTSGPEAERVMRVANRIAAATERLTGTRTAWRVALVEDPRANAFALPGGGIAVLSGILPLAPTDDGLAAIIGHEMAHVVARHGAERLTHQWLAQVGQTAIGFAVGDMDPATQRVVLGAIGLGAQVGVLMPFSRTHEAEADRIGLILMSAACYDPRAAPEFWQRMMAAARRGPPEFLSTHPSHATRIRELQAAVDEAMAARSEAGCPFPAQPAS